MPHKVLLVDPGSMGGMAGAQLTQLISHVPATGLCIPKAKSIIVRLVCMKGHRFLTHTMTLFTPVESLGEADIGCAGSPVSCLYHLSTSMPN